MRVGGFNTGADMDDQIRWCAKDLVIVDRENLMDMLGLHHP
jgi:hypothetical protein